MSTYLIFPDKSQLKLDLTETISPEYSSDISSQPVESGDQGIDSVSDHVTNNPIMLNVSGVISGSKKNASHTPQVESFSNRLQKAWSNKELVIIQTENKTYKNFIIESFSLPQNNEAIGDIKLSIRLKQIITAITQFTTLELRQPVTKANTSKAVNNRHSADKNKGKKPSTPANKSQQKKLKEVAKSWGAEILDFITK